MNEQEEWQNISIIKPKKRKNAGRRTKRKRTEDEDSREKRKKAARFIIFYALFGIIPGVLSYLGEGSLKTSILIGVAAPFAVFFSAGMISGLLYITALAAQAIMGKIYRLMGLDEFAREIDDIKKSKLSVVSLSGIDGIVIIVGYIMLIYKLYNELPGIAR